MRLYERSGDFIWNLHACQHCECYTLRKHFPNGVWSLCVNIDHMSVSRQRKPNSYDRLRKVMMTAYLEPEQAAALRALSAKTRVPMQSYLREGLEYVLAKHGRKL
jgi:hypothetical protein